MQEAVKAGSRLSLACDLIGLSLRTLQRWKKDPNQEDRRAGPLKPPPHSLNEIEKKQIVDIANSIPYRDLSPWQIVPKLADTGIYVASESSFYRVLKKKNLLSHRSKCRPATNERPKDLIATRPNEIWSWDITYLKSPIAGSFYFLYLVMDVFSRMIVGWTIEETESSEHSSSLISDLCKAYGIKQGTLTLHADNGGPMKGATMLATLQKLQVLPSFSRPSVSDDNPYSESLFKTLKYRPSYPDGPFDSIQEARTWITKFVSWYNQQHLHSGIRFVTPQSRHEGVESQILEKRHTVYMNAKQSNPSRWTGKTRNWSPITEVSLNPLKNNFNQEKGPVPNEKVGLKLLKVDPGHSNKCPTFKSSHKGPQEIARPFGNEDFLQRCFAGSSA